MKTINVHVCYYRKGSKGSMVIKMQNNLPCLKNFRKHTDIKVHISTITLYNFNAFTMRHICDKMVR